ncbi:hypothetical protein GCM10017620_24520 [Brevundimonas intermedia]|uniref:DUF3618 domain-containing protein n=1 Tax=Brevundimonas intermedia TaxID=74315 RepID=A0ABQ5T9J8_9CAUL|nr:hypothetical protein [Brevundimonas intermedia]GLK49479.1 hypothetical protein GCM10017620_24520 [Brevundimonas intermedia]
MTKTPGERITATEKDIERIDLDIADMRGDLREIKTMAQASERMLRWGMGAAAAFGAMIPLLMPKIVKALGLD